MLYGKWYKHICNYIAITFKMKYTFHVFYTELPSYKRGGNSNYSTLKLMFMLVITPSHCIANNICCDSCQVLSCIHGNV